MSNITLPSNVGNPTIDTFTRLEGEDTVHMQAVVPVDPVTGEPNASTEATAQSLKELNDTLLLMLGAILEKLPRIGAADRLVADLTETSLPTVTTVTTVGTVSAVTQLAALGSTTVNVTKASDGIPTHLANAGTFHIYNNIIVS